MARITILPGIVQQFEAPTQEEYQALLDRVERLEERFPEPSSDPLQIDGVDVYVQYADAVRDIVTLAPAGSNDRYNITQVEMVVEVGGALTINDVAAPVSEITTGINGIDAVVTFDTSNVSPGQRAKFFTIGQQVFT